MLGCVREPTLHSGCLLFNGEQCSNLQAPMNYCYTKNGKGGGAARHYNWPGSQPCTQTVPDHAEGGELRQGRIKSMGLLHCLHPRAGLC